MYSFMLACLLAFTQQVSEIHLLLYISYFILNCVVFHHMIVIQLIHSTVDSSWVVSSFQLLCIYVCPSGTHFFLLSI